MVYWRDGRISELISEGNAIQKRMSQKKKEPKTASNEERFIRLMEEGKSQLHSVALEVFSVVCIKSHLK